MGYNEQQLHFEAYQGRGLRSLGNAFLLLSFLAFFFFPLLPCLPVLFTTPNSNQFSLLYCPVMSTPWHPPPLQTPKLKLLDLATLRHIQQPSSLKQRGQIWGEWPKPDSLHCLSANLYLLPSGVTVSYQRKNLTFCWCFLNNCFLKMQENISTWK